jgi:hypothetical protein
MGGEKPRSIVREATYISRRTIEEVKTIRTIREDRYQ